MKNVRNNKGHFVKGHPTVGKVGAPKGTHNSSRTEFKKGVSVSPQTQFQQGLIPWNKGKKGVMNAWNKGKKMKHSGSFKKGHKLSEASLKKLSESLKKNHPKHWLGKKRDSSSWTGISRMDMRGEKNCNWKGGITPINRKIRTSLEYKIWRRAVFERDQYTCIWCGDNQSRNLEADHIKPFAYFPELRFAIDNGRTLCKDCHKKTDTYGNKWRTEREKS